MPRKLLLVLAVAGIAALLGVGLMPAALDVDVATVTRGSIRVTVDQDGKTRIRERYVVSAPLAGRLLRIELEPGDSVEAGRTTLAVIEPRDPELLDARAIAMAEARVRAAEAALQKAGTVRRQAAANQADAERDLKRERDMAKTQAATISAVEDAELLLRIRGEEVRSARHAEEIAQFELDQARAALIRSRPITNGESTGSGDSSWTFGITAPVDGRVLRVFQESTAVVTAGTPLIELGDPSDLEVEIDVLSRDAVRVPTGAAVLLEQWGGEAPLAGRVDRVEPSAFTKVSTLGVEEQRVNVIVRLMDPPTARRQLGDGFRVEARIVVDEADGVVKAPTSALFRSGGEWAVFAVVDGKAEQRAVQLGLQNGLEAEVTEGLAEGDEVVVHPGDDVADGVGVRPL